MRCLFMHFEREYTVDRKKKDITICELLGFNLHYPDLNRHTFRLAAASILELFLLLNVNSPVYPTYPTYPTC